MQTASAQSSGLTTTGLGADGQEGGQMEARMVEFGGDAAELKPGFFNPACPLRRRCGCHCAVLRLVDARMDLECMDGTECETFDIES